MRRIFTSLLLALLVPASTYAAGFRVSDIRVEGLQHVELGAVFRTLPIEVGDEVDEAQLAQAVRELFATGYYEDIRVARDGAVLVLHLKERPSISKIGIEGNKVIDTDALKAGLEGAGLREGDVFQRATLERIRLELLRMYAAQGRYSARVTTEVEALPENRVGLNIAIHEGENATIQHINVVGNQVFDDEELTDLFELRTPRFWSFFSNADRYSREKLSGDLERLRSHYLDRGYVNFRIDSTQVSITPDKQHVYITTNIDEGEQFHVRDLTLAGELAVPREELLPLVSIKPGDVFSRRELIATSEALTRRLGDAGYLFANVNPVPEVHAEDNSVSLRFFVDPGKRIYVRRINFRGNTKSADEVLRREMRQMEAGWASADKIEQSKLRLQRVGYFGDVSVETRPVPGVDDQVDLEYSIEEQMSGNLSASVGFSQSSGLILAASVSQRNFLGSGKEVSFSINNSDTDTEYSFSYLDPYYTIDGVSRGFNLFYRQTDFDEDDAANFSTDTFGGGVNFGYPIDEYQRLRFGLDFANIKVKAGSGLPDEIRSFIDKEGTNYNELSLTGAWTDNHLNRGILADEGYSQSVSLELATPGSDLLYYKLRYRGQLYAPVTDGWTLKFATGLGYGDSYGSTSDLPFYKKYYTGGFDKVRGFKNNSIGPRANNADRDPLGGNVLVEGNIELIFPTPFVDSQKNLRTLFFLDAGTVVDTNCVASNPNCESEFNLDDVRLSAGIGLSWITAIGPLSFSLATPLREQDGDESETFQFALGRTF